MIPTTATMPKEMTVEHLDENPMCESEFYDDSFTVLEDRCENQAEWIHTKNCCPGTDFSCDDCMTDYGDDDDWVECSDCGRQFPTMKAFVKTAMRIGAVQ